jgi:tetratricopeptide (TPR) repeat protein
MLMTAMANQPDEGTGTLPSVDAAKSSAEGSGLCFVIMPIGSPGTDHYEHYKAMYQHIRPILNNFGYEVIRADDVHKSGAITRDIILRLAEADLVIADLTGLNPNVFYEVGVRHALRARGTVLMLDRTRNDHIPFDLSAYRVISYRGDLVGLSSLMEALTSYLAQLPDPGTEVSSQPDNPVHDWLPGLPPNIVTISKTSAEGILRQEIQDLRRQIEHYRSVYGEDAARGFDEDVNPLMTVTEALEDVRAGNAPSTIMGQVDAAVRDRDLSGLLSTIKRVIEARITLRPVDLLVLASAAGSLGVPHVRTAVLEHASALYPSNDEVRTALLGNLAHSDEPSARARARVELAQELGIDEDEKEFTKSVAKNDRSWLSSFSLMLDAFHTDGMHEKALALIESAIALYGNDSSLLLRNRARALGLVGRQDEAFEVFSTAISCHDVDDTSARWFGNELHNIGRHVDAAEVYLLACWLDPDDAAGYTNFLDEVSFALFDPYALKPTGGLRSLPDPVDKSLMISAWVAALSCSVLNEDDYRRAKRAFARSDLVLSHGEERNTRLERKRWIVSAYEMFRSPLTKHAAPAAIPRTV